MKLRILWIDDQLQAIKSTWLPTVVDRLRAQGKEISIDCEKQGGTAIVRLIEEHYDLVILDIRLVDSTAQSTSDESSERWSFARASHVLDQMRSRQRVRPVILFSAYLEDQYSNAEGVVAAFPKTTEGVEHLASFLLHYLERPPLTFVAFADLHLGLLNEEGFDLALRRLVSELEEQRKQWQPDHMIVAGDFVWTQQTQDLARAEQFLRASRHALGLQAGGTLHFCPGNHDIALKSPTPWAAFQEFVSRLASDDEAILARYGDQFGGIRPFRSREDLVGVGLGVRPGVVFAGLNSIDENTHERRFGEVGDRQLHRVEHLLRVVSPGGDDLRVALVHHPMFPVPDDTEEERILGDSARVLRELCRLRFELVINGHSHYSSVHEHRFVVINSSGRSPTGARPGARKLTVLALGTAGGNPNVATPVKQYAIVQIGHRDRLGLRSLRIHTRIFDPETKSFCDGQSTSFTLGEPL